MLGAEVLRRQLLDPSERQSWLGSGVGRRGVRPNSLDHGAHAVGALRREMLLEAERAKGAKRVDGQDLVRRPVGKERNRNSDQSAHEVRVAVAAKMQGLSAIPARLRLALQPDLADAAPHLGGVIVGRRAQWLERVTELDDIAVAILPIIKGVKVFADRLDRRQGNLATFVARALYGRACAAGQCVVSQISRRTIFAMGAARSFKVGALFDRCLAGAAPEQSRTQSAAATSIADLQSSAFSRKALA